MESDPAPGETPADPAACLARLGEIVRAVASRRYLASTEADLARGVAEALEAAGIAAERERRLPGAGRLDFFVAPGVAVELKLSGPLSALARQVSAYAAHPGVGAVLVVTARAAHARLPESICGKPLRVLALGFGGL